MLDFDEALMNENGYVWGFDRDYQIYHWDGSSIQIGFDYYAKGKFYYVKNKFYYDSLIVDTNTHTIIPGNFISYYLDDEGDEIECTRDKIVEKAHEPYTCNDIKLSSTLREEIERVINDYFMTEEEIDGVIEYVKKKIEKELSQNK